ncbi:MAG: hypothetical protein LWW77_11185, partial [Propionibacteriales bacterium]|nr:hypothetical protein [Propionibacteriales bacterium]
MNVPANGRRVPGTLPVAAVAAVASLLSAVFWVGSGLALAFPEAQARLTNARHLFDSAAPTTAALLGNTWLPFPQLLSAIPSALLPLWHSGWASAFVGAGCIAVTAAGLYRAAARWGAGRLARLVAVAVVVANPGTLFLASTALAEPVLIACLATCLAGLATFLNRSRQSSPGEIAIFAGIPAAAATLTDPSGWMLVATAAVFVTVASWRRTHRGYVAAVAAFGMVTPALAAATLWLVYNWVTFADPRAFLAGLRSPTPAGEGLAPSGAPLAGDFAGALTAVGVAAHSVVGWPLLIVAALGLLFALASFRRIDVVLFMITASAPMLFTVVAMYAGGVVVWNSAVTSTAIWHNRVGVAVIIPVAVFTAIMIEATVRDPRWHGWVRVVTAALTAIALASPVVSMVADPARSLVLAEARDSYARSTDSYQAAEWLAARYDGGGIGLDESVWTN